jgi:carboxyl-terminal processing protease
VTVIRYPISAPEPVLAQLVQTADGSRIGYIFLPTFFDKTIPEQVKKALEGFGVLDGLILDNRMNGGGSSDVLEPVLSYFTSGVLGDFVSRAETHPLDITASPVANSQEVPLVVLVGKDTVSFGEVFAGVLQDSGRAKVAGQTSQGNVEVLHGYDFVDGSQVWIAQESFDPAHSHAKWEHSGIHPDVEAFADWDTFTFETDPGVAAALRLLGH